MQKLMLSSLKCDSDRFFQRSLVFHGTLVSLAFVLISAGIVPLSLAQPPATPKSTSGDQTNAADKVSAAIKQRIDSGQWDDAATLAQQYFDAIEPGNDEAAKWAIALSKLRVEILLRSPLNKEQPLVDAAAEPIERVLVAYPDHRFAAWMRFQRLAIDTAVARRRALAIQAAPGDDAKRLPALAALIRSASGLRDLQDEVVASIAKAFAQRDQAAMIDQLMSLRNAIATERVGVLLSRGELFPADSDDFLAAAAEANQAAIDALAMVRNDAAVLGDLTTMRCDALLRMGQPDEATRLLAPLVAAARGTEAGTGTDSKTRPLDDATRAMAVRIAIELDQLGAAEKWLDSHYGDQPLAAPASPLSDLARLRFLIASESTLTDQWIKAIGERGGDYLYRRAQTITIELLGPEAAKGANSDLVIAEAGVLLRKGDAAAAASLLETHLTETVDAPSAMKVATVASAVLVRLTRQSDAAKILAKTAARFADYPGSSDLMIQAAILFDQIGAADEADQILRELLMRWTTDRKAFLARDWLVERTQKSSTTLAAAIVATPDFATDAAFDAAIVSAVAAKDPSEAQEIERLYSATWQQAEALWIRAFAEVDPWDHSLRLTEVYRSLREQAAQSLGQSQSAPALRCRKVIATLFQDADQLSDPKFRDLPFDDRPLIDWLYAIRTGGAIVTAPSSQDNDLRGLVAIALMIEGQKTPAMRATLGKSMIPLLSDVPQADLARCQALVWNGQWQPVPKLLDGWIAGKPPGEQTEIASLQAAKLLGQSSDPAARQVALQRYLKLSKEVSTRSPIWHMVKLATIEAMIEAGEREEAEKLARYVLITRPPADAETRQRYEGFAKK